MSSTGRTTTIVRLATCLGALGLLPLLGAWLTGVSPAEFLALPRPLSARVQPAFSWPVFVSLAILIALLAGTLLVAGIRAGSGSGMRSGPRGPSPSRGAGRMPWWGWFGVGLVGVSWTLAWTRLEFFAAGQHYTFTPLWLGYILAVNGLVQRRRGHCLATRRPLLFLGLFPLSVGFWWYFEFLNRFTGNWFYVSVEHFSPLEYTVLASAAFATVLPAVLGTIEALDSLPRLADALARLRPVPPRVLRSACAAAVPLASIGLVGVGASPAHFFPVVWLAPGLLLLGTRALAGGSTVLTPLERGDWRPIGLPALAALACGFLWELWNSQSLAHWEYAIPFVHRFEIFEMPLLGYAGYLPFGVVCLIVASSLGPDVCGWASPGPTAARGGGRSKGD